MTCGKTSVELEESHANPGDNSEVPLNGYCRVGEEFFKGPQLQQRGRSSRLGLGRWTPPVGAVDGFTKSYSPDDSSRLGAAKSRTPLSQRTRILRSPKPLHLGGVRRSASPPLGDPATRAVEPWRNAEWRFRRFAQTHQTLRGRLTAALPRRSALEPLHKHSQHSPWRLGIAFTISSPRRLVRQCRRERR